MGTDTFSQRANAYLDRAVNAISGELEGEDRVRVLWLSFTLFFTVGGYWLLRSIKDPIISTIDGVGYLKCRVFTHRSSSYYRRVVCSGGGYSAGEDPVIVCRVCLGYLM